MRINGYKVKLAQVFLNQLKKELVKVGSKEDLVLEMYSNCREQGYHLQTSRIDGDNVVTWGCSFSENRNSDELVVYVGTGSQRFEMQGNVPDQRAYDSARYYGPREGELKKATSYIITSLREFIGNKEEMA